MHPDRISEAALARVDVVIATGESAIESLRDFARMRQMDDPRQPSQGAPRLGQALIWFAGQSPPLLVAAPKADQERRRHLRQYAQGELSPNQSFYFRGRSLSCTYARKISKRFCKQMADDVDDDTWLFHLRRGDYSTWFKNLI